MMRGVGLVALVIIAAAGWWAFAPQGEPRPFAFEAPANLEEVVAAEFPAASQPEPGASSAPATEARPAAPSQRAPLTPTPPNPEHSGGPAAFAAVAPERGTPARTPAREHAKRVRQVRETPEFRDVLRRPDAGQRVLSLNLFDDVGYDVVFDHVERRDPMGNSLVASGRVVGVADSDVVAVFNGESLAANLLLPSGELFQIRSTGNGQLQIKEVDRASLGDCVVEGHHHVAALESADLDAGGSPAASESGGGAGVSGGEVANFDPATTIDMLVVYSPAARSYVGGVAGMQALIDLNVATINRIYSESGAVQQLRLVGSAEVSYSESSGDSMGDALSDVTDGMVPNVRSLRDQLGADLVTFVVLPAPYRGTAGIAWVPRVDSIQYSSYIGYSAIAAQAFDDPTVLAHELGHNQGNNHDAETVVRQGGTTAGSASRTRPWAFGYIEPQDRFHTVMAYGSSCGWCQRLGRFSNPNLRFDGRNTGTSAADVRRVLNETVSPVSSFRQSQMSFQTPELISPAPGTELAPGSVRFTWDDRGVAATGWWIQVGSGLGGTDLYDSGALPSNARAMDVPDLPIDGRTLHVRLWYQTDGSWSSRDTTYSAADVDVASLLSGPAPGSLLDGSDVTVSWSQLPGVADEWQIHIGSSFGASDIFDSGLLGSSGTLTIPGLPTDGRTLHVRVFYRLAGGPWNDVDFTYTAATIIADPDLVMPAAGSTLAGASQTFSWSQLDGLVDAWWFYLGSSPGASDIVDSGNLGGQSTLAVNGIPTDGRPLHARLWFRRGSSPWLFVDFQFTAATLVTEVTTPAAGSTLTGPAASFTWAPGGASQFWLYVGSSPGGKNFHDSGNLGASLTTTVGGLPEDGSTVYVRLWFRNGSASWSFVDSSLTAAAGGGGGGGGGGGASPMVTSPAAGPLAPGATLGWTDPGGSVRQWWVYVGSSMGASNLFDSGNLGSATSTSVGSLSGASGTIYVRLWYRTSATGSWSFVDTSYLAAVPDFVAPASGSTLAGANVNFSWSPAGTGADDWWLYLGSSLGGRDVLDSGYLATDTNLAVAGLPTDGRTIYARLWFRSGSSGAWSYVDRTFQASP